MREVVERESGERLGVVMDGMAPEEGAWLARVVDEADWLGSRASRWSEEYVRFVAGLRYNHGVPGETLARGLVRCAPSLMTSRTKSAQDRAYLLELDPLPAANRDGVDGALMAAAITEHAKDKRLAGRHIVLSDYRYSMNVAASLSEDGWSVVCAWASSDSDDYSVCVKAPRTLVDAGDQHDAWGYASSVLRSGWIIGMSHDYDPWELLHNSGVVGPQEPVLEGNGTFWRARIIYPIGQLIPASRRQPSSLEIVGEESIEDWPISVFAINPEAGLIKESTLSSMVATGLPTLREAELNLSRVSRPVAEDLASLSAGLGLDDPAHAFERRARDAPEWVPSGSMTPRVGVGLSSEEWQAAAEAQGRSLERRLRLRAQRGQLSPYALHVDSAAVAGARWLERMNRVRIVQDSKSPALLLVSLVDG